MVPVNFVWSISQLTSIYSIFSGLTPNLLNQINLFVVIYKSTILCLSLPNKTMSYVQESKLIQIIISHIIIIIIFSSFLIFIYWISFSNTRLSRISDKVSLCTSRVLTSIDTSTQHIFNIYFYFYIFYTSSNLTF